MLEETFRLRMDPKVGVIRDDDRLCGVAPAGRFLFVDAQARGNLGSALDHVGGAAQVALRHQVRVDVVVGDGAVLVGAGDAVDPEPPGSVVVPQRAPQPGGLHQQLGTHLALECVVIGRGRVPEHRVRDVGVDVEGGRSGRPVARAFLSVNRPPREGGALKAELRSALARQIERPSAASAVHRRRRRGAV